MTDLALENSRSATSERVTCGTMLPANRGGLEGPGNESPQDSPLIKGHGKGETSPVLLFRSSSTELQHTITAQEIPSASTYYHEGQSSLALHLLIGTQHDYRF